MGKPRGASKTNPSPETSGDSLLDEIWVKLEIKLNAWIANTLPAIVKDLVKAQACKAVDDFVSSSEFTSSLPESLLFDSAEQKDSHKATEDKIAKLECVNSQLLEQIDDLEQYTRRTNVRIFGIPEAAGDVRENTDDLAINFFANELGIQLSLKDISRSHCVGKRSPTKPRPIIVRLVRHNYEGRDPTESTSIKGKQEAI